MHVCKRPEKAGTRAPKAHMQQAYSLDAAVAAERIRGQLHLAAAPQHALAVGPAAVDLQQDIAQADAAGMQCVRTAGLTIAQGRR